MQAPYGSSPLIAAGQWSVGLTGSIGYTAGGPAVGASGGFVKSQFGIGSLVRASAGTYNLTLLAPFTDNSAILQVTAPNQGLTASAAAVPTITYPVATGTLPATAVIQFGASGAAVDLAFGAILQVVCTACFDGIDNTP